MDEDMNTYTVASGDSLWSIAAKLLGKGERWPVIWQHNRETILAVQRKNPRFRDGTFAEGPRWIFPGTVLRVTVENPARSTSGQ
jgi:nucleoid-associated protein YgaU